MDGVAVLRPATVADAPAIARLHAESWRAHYRGAYATTISMVPCTPSETTSGVRG